MLEQKISEAKAARRNYLLKIGIALISISILCALVIFFASSHQFKSNKANAELELPLLKAGLETRPIQATDIPDEQLREAYIDGLSYYQNTLKPELDKINLIQWNKARSEQLALLKDKALAAFTAADYTDASNSIKHLNQLAQATITDSQQQFEQAFSKAQSSYDTGNYDEAKLQINKALILDRSAEKAIELSTGIDKLPEILQQLKKINNAKAENNLNKELSLIKDLLKISPQRTDLVKRKQDLINSISYKNFDQYITQSHQALKQGNIQLAKKKISLAKRIFPKHQELADLTRALQNIEENQRFERHQQKAHSAMRSDDWGTVKSELEQALQVRGNNEEIQQTITLASSIVTLNNAFKQQIKSPYRLSNKNLMSRLQSKISQASTLAKHSPSLSKNKDTLTRLINTMNTKVAVQVSSDEQTTILVRGVGVVGKTLLKTIQLLPGKYTFEGKRKGFKSKLLDVLVPYDKTDFRVNIRCDEPI